MARMLFSPSLLVLATSYLGAPVAALTLSGGTGIASTTSNAPFGNVTVPLGTGATSLGQGAHTHHPDPSGHVSFVLHTSPGVSPGHDTIVPTQPIVTDDVGTTNLPGGSAHTSPSTNAAASHHTQVGSAGGPFVSSNATQHPALGTAGVSTGGSNVASGISFIGSFATGNSGVPQGTGVVPPSSLTAVVGGSTGTFLRETATEYATITAPTTATVSYAYTALNSETSTTAAAVLVGAGGVFYKGSPPSGGGGGGGGGIGGGGAPPPIIGIPDINIGGGGGKDFLQKLIRGCA